MNLNHLKMDSLTEDYQLQLNNIVRLMPTDLDLALMLVKSQGINLSHVVNHMIACRVKIPRLISIVDTVAGLSYATYDGNDVLASWTFRCSNQELYNKLSTLLIGLLTHLEYEQ